MHITVRRWRVVCFAFAMFMSAAVSAQDMAGQWQGTISSGAQDLRVVVRIAKTEAGAWTGTLYRIDEFSRPFPLTAVAVQNGTFTFSSSQGTYEGRMNPDATAITGTLNDGRTFPLELHRATAATAWPLDVSPHTVRFVPVDKDVTLEVLDWGGSGRPLVLLAGLGDNAHVFDLFAPKLTASYHVFGITRRGFGASSTPPTGYSADRLGDDVLAVVDALKLRRPVLAGHSIAGGELSSIGSRHPELVAGLIYLDAAYGWAFYDDAQGDFDVDTNALRARLDGLPTSGYSPAAMHEVLDTYLPKLERDLREELKNQDAMSPAMRASQYAPIVGTAAAVLAGTQKFTRIPVPVLAIYAVPHDLLGPPMTDAERATYEARDLLTTGAQADAFAAGVPGARVVRLRRARHYVFRSNEADVLREMNAFIATLP